MCKQSLTALLVAFEFYLPIFFGPFVNDHQNYRSWMSDYRYLLFQGVFFFSLETLLVIWPRGLELLFLQYTIASPFDISPSAFHETWLRKEKFRFEYACKVSENFRNVQEFWKQYFVWCNTVRFWNSSRWLQSRARRQKSSRISCSMAEETSPILREIILKTSN